MSQARKERRVAAKAHTMKAAARIIQSPGEMALALTDSLLRDEDGFVLPRPAEFLRQFPQEMIMSWATRFARYTLVTEELRDWLIGFTAGTRAIEVAAGMGDIGHSVGIPMTDSYVQDTPELRALYEDNGQVPTEPPTEVEKLDALAAIAKYEPEVVIASFLTQAYQDGDTPKKIGSSVYGPNESKILDAPSVRTYIHIGNAHTHRHKRILARPHETLRPEWLVTRAFDQSKNCIWIWQR